MKKSISILLSLALTIGILTGCTSVSTSESGSEKLRIVTTISRSTTGYGRYWGSGPTTWN